MPITLASCRVKLKAIRTGGRSVMQLKSEAKWILLPSLQVANCQQPTTVNGCRSLKHAVRLKGWLKS